MEPRNSESTDSLPQTFQSEVNFGNSSRLIEESNPIKGVASEESCDLVAREEMIPHFHEGTVSFIPNHYKYFYL